MRIELPLFFDAKQDIDYEALGIENQNEWEETETRIGIFYHIDCLLPYRIDGKEYTEVVSGKRNVICSLPMKKVDELIDYHKRFGR